MTRIALVALVVVFAAAACGQGTQQAGQEGPAGTEPAPQETVTVTETVTPDSPSSTEEAAPAAADVCAEQEGLAEQAFIFVTTPVPGEQVANPFTVRGCANTFEANVQWRLVDRDGAAVTEGHTTATCGTGCVGTFEFEVRYPEAEPRILTLEVYEASAEDGSVQLLNAIPVRTGDA